MGWPALWRFTSATKHPRPFSKNCSSARVVATVRAVELSDRTRTRRRGVGPAGDRRTASVSANARIGYNSTTVIPRVALKRIGERACRFLGLDRAADVLHVRSLEGFLSRPKIELLYRTIFDLGGPGAIAEIGSWKGKSTAALALAVRRSGRKDVVYAIDHHQGSPEHKEVLGGGGRTWPDFQRTVKNAGVEDIVTPLRMDSVSGAHWLAEREIKLKFLLVDGAHDEASVTQDIESFLPLLLPQSRIALDDAEPETWWPGVYRSYERLLKPRARELGWAGSMLMVEFTG